MNKKGIGGEVDWILAIGLFLVYLGLILVVFKPGVTPAVDHKIVLDVVQRSIEEKLTWKVTKQPLFTELLRYQAPGTGRASVTEDSTQYRGDQNVFEFVGECQRNALTRRFDCAPFPPFTGLPSAPTELRRRVMFFYVTSTENPLPGSVENEVRDADAETPERPTGRERVSGDSDSETARRDVDRRSGRDRDDSGERRLRFGLENGNPVLRVNTAFSSALTRRKYLVVYSQDPLVQAPLTQLNRASGSRRACILREDFLTRCPPQNPPVTFTYPADCAALPLQFYPEHDCRVRYTLGAPEVVDGLHLQRLLSLRTAETRFTTDCGPPQNLQSYDCVKRVFGVPPVKDFKIEVRTSEADVNPFINYGFPDVPVPLEARVDVRQFSSFILTEEAVKVPVVVKISVW